MSQVTAMTVVLAGVMGLATASPFMSGGQSSFRHQMAGFDAPHVARGRAPFSLRTLLDIGDTDDSGEDADVAISPPSIEADIPVTYFGPSPSQVQKELIGPYQLLKSGVVNETAGTVTLPLYYGKVELADDAPDGKTGGVFYVVTDTTDEDNAAQIGINHSPKLIYANIAKGARKAYLDKDLVVHFKGGAVDFSPSLSVTPGSDSAYPPSAATAGAVGDAHYSPYFVLENAGSNVYNGPIISMGATAEELQAYCYGIPSGKEEAAKKVLHDKVVSICPDDDGLGGTVTLKLTAGFSFSRPVFYVSLDSSDETVAAMEGVTVAPGMTDIKTGTDDTLFSAVERFFITINGYTNSDAASGDTSHPSRQGLNSALAGEGSPLNVLGGIPTLGTDYSPAWDGNLGEWTAAAIENGYRDRLLEEFQILGYVARGLITGPDGAAYGSASSGMFLINAPIVFRFL